MITATKNNVTVPTNAFQEAKDKLKKISLQNSNDNKPLPTKQAIQDELQERTLALVTSTEDLPAIKNHIEKEGFTIIKTKTIQLSSEQAQELYADHISQNYYDKMTRWLSSGSNICALVLEKNNAVSDWRSLMGPTAYKKARKSNPNSIRALFGKDMSQNATHGSDSEANAKKEINFIFSESLLDVSAADLHHQQHDVNVPAEENDAYVPSPITTDQADNDKKIEDTPLVVASKENLVDAITEHKKEIRDTETELNKGGVSPVIDQEKQTQNDAVVEITEDVTSTGNDMEMPSSDVVTEETEDGPAIVIDKKGDTLSVVAEHDAALFVNSETVLTEFKEASMLVEGKKEDGVPNGDNKENIIVIDTVTNVDTIQKAADLIVSRDDISKDISNTCIEITPDASLKDEEMTTSINTVNMSAPIDIEKQGEKVPIIINATISDAETITITPPAESGLTLSTNSSASLKVNVQDENLAKPLEIAIKSTSSSTKKTATKTVVKKEAIIPSSSRIRPPSIKRGQNGNMIQSGEPIGRNCITSSRISSANSSAGTTRIARLSPSVTIKNEPPVIEKKKVAINRDAPKKPATKVSKNLPRVATMATPKQPTKEDGEDGEKKIKKRGSSTRNFISRLTAPTVASQNKKADSDATTTTTPTTSGASRRTTVSGKRSSAVRPVSSTSKV